MKYRIVSDSSSNITSLPGQIEFRTTPLKIIVDGEEFVDEEGIDTEKLVLKMEQSDRGSTTSCPNIQDWLDAFEGADCVFAVTITSKLSGSYNSAVNAKEIFMEEHPEAKVHIIDSLATGGEMQLLVEMLKNLMMKGKSFEEILTEINAYHDHTHLVFSLESLNNLAKNGRVPMLMAKAAGFLNMRFIGIRSPIGELQQKHIVRGEKKTIRTLMDEITNTGYQGGKVRISHCFNIKSAEALKNALLELYPNADIRIIPMTGLCSYYAERGGMIIGWEDNVPAAN